MLRAEFRDVKFEMPQERIEAIADSLSAYFSYQFGEKDSIQFDLGPLVTLGEDEAYYGRNSTSRRDEFIYKAVMEACLSSSDSVNFSVYDYDSNGTVDNVLLLLSGESEALGAGEDHIWPQQAYLSDWSTTLSLNGKKIETFCVSSEADGLGTLCHEFSHSLGLQDLYDTDGSASGGTSPGVWGTLSLMDKGNKLPTPPNFCAIELEYLGIGECDTLKAGSWKLEPLSRGRRFVKAFTDTPEEFFLLECRHTQGWDESIGCSGLAIYHIDRSDRDAGYSYYYRQNLSASERWLYGQVNCNPDYECAALIPARTDASGVSQVTFPQMGIREFTSCTTPPFVYHSGTPSPLAITDIVADGDGSVSFTVFEPIAITEISSFQDAAIISWKTAGQLGDPCPVELSYAPVVTKPDTLTVSTKEHNVRLENLQSGTRYNVEVKVLQADRKSYSASGSFRTKTVKSGSGAYIYLAGTLRSGDGSFVSGAKIPLEVFNCPDAEQIIWTFDGKAVTVGPDGYFTVTDSGTLKATILLSDGSVETIIKEITVK